ncbi:hypothetical protein NFI96_002206, partial [Prochilodus magdalenae]
MVGSSGSTESCPHLLEAIPCEDPVCFEWQVQSEGACVPKEGTCGTGNRTQTMVCANSQ